VLMVMATEISFLELCSPPPGDPSSLARARDLRETT
jgi:hypothetical protein